MNLLTYIPNILTWMRILVIPFFIYFTLAKNILCIWLYSICALTDALDGWLARRWRVESVWGAFLDPIADKLLVQSGLAMVIYHSGSFLVGICWILMLLRDLYISWLRSTGYHIPVSSKAKIKSILLFVATVVLLIAILYTSKLVFYFGIVLLLISTYLSIDTFVSYIVMLSGKTNSLRE